MRQTKSKPATVKNNMKQDELLDYLLNSDLDVYVIRGNARFIYDAAMADNLDVTYPEIVDAIAIAQKDPMIVLMAQTIK